MKKCYWRHIEAHNYGKSVEFVCDCKIADEQCEAFRKFLRSKYEFVEVTTTYYKDNGDFDHETYNVTVNMFNIPFAGDDEEER